MLEVASERLPEGFLAKEAKPPRSLPRSHVELVFSTHPVAQADPGLLYASCLILSAGIPGLHCHAREILITPLSSVVFHILPRAWRNYFFDGYPQNLC